jgi:hypothetical protein
MAEVKTISIVPKTAPNGTDERWKARNGSNWEKIAILISKEAEFVGQQHIQNPPKSALGKKIYDHL